MSKRRVKLFLTACLVGRGGRETITVEHEDERGQTTILASLDVRYQPSH
jgi:hypothetical protein